MKKNPFFLFSFYRFLAWIRDISFRNVLTLILLPYLLFFFSTSCTKGELILRRASYITYVSKTPKRTNFFVTFRFNLHSC